MVGFTQSVEVAELVALGREQGLPVMTDLGSGVLFPLTVGDVSEPDVSSIVRQGANVVTFSGDKLLGGPQAGLVVGDEWIVREMKKNPLARAVRVDKMTLAALEMVLRWYLEGRGSELPLWQMLGQSAESLRQRAAALAAKLAAVLPDSVTVRTQPDRSAVGGGSMPGAALPTTVVTLEGVDPKAVVRWERALRAQPTPVIVRVSRGKLIIDLRTVFPDQEALLVQMVVNALTHACHQERQTV
jgi:L-seryl-tRNA(Ser) seleniumtransferase